MDRLGGLAATLGGMLLVAKGLWDWNDAPPYPTDITDTLFFIVPLLFLVAIWVLYTRFRGRIGEPSRENFEAFIAKAGFVAAFIGAVMGIVGLISASAISDALWIISIDGLFVMLVGLVFVGIANIRTAALPRWGSLPLIIGSLGLVSTFASFQDPNVVSGVFGSLLMVIGLISWVLFGLAWVVLGYALWSQKDKEAQHPAHVR